MPVSCVVSSCKSRGKLSGVSFHRLPKDPILRAKWVKAINRPGWEPTSSNQLVCSAHFREEDIDRTSLSSVRLREGVVPSLFNGAQNPVRKSRHVPQQRNLSVEELTTERDKYKRELAEVLEELGVLFKERKRLFQLRRRIRKRISLAKESLASENSTASTATELEDLLKRQNENNADIVGHTRKYDEVSAKKLELKKKLRQLLVNLQFRGVCLPSSSGTQSHGGAGSSKRAKPESGKGGKTPKGRPKKIMKTIEDEEAEVDSPERLLQDPLEIIEIEESNIKDEMYDTEEFNEMTSEHILPDDGPSQNQDLCENILCTPVIIKEEPQDDMADDHMTPEADTAAPEFVGTVIKSEARDEEEEEEEEQEQEDNLGEAELKWRCPLVSCPELFSEELEMFKHLNLNHNIKGLALVTKAVKMSPASAAVTSPDALPGSSSPSPLPLVAPVTVASLPLASSSCGSSSVTTTTISYSLSTAWSSLVTTTVSNSSITSVSSATHSVTLPTGSVSAAPISSPAVLSASTLDVSAASSPASSSLPSYSPTPHTVTNASQGPENPVAPLSDPELNFSVTAKFHITPQQTLQPVQASAEKVSTGPLLEIFNPTERKTEDLSPCAMDDSEVFSISLARFPQNRRAKIKRKMVDVVDCMVQKNVGPDKIIIAFYEERSDSRTM